MTGWELLGCLALLFVGRWLLSVQARQDCEGADLTSTLTLLKGLGAMICLVAIIWAATLVPSIVRHVDPRNAELSERLFVLVAGTLAVWLLPNGMVLWTPSRNFVGHREFDGAYFSSRWFGWEPGPLAASVLRFVMFAALLRLLFAESFM